MQDCEVAPHDRCGYEICNKHMWKAGDKKQLETWNFFQHFAISCVEVQKRSFLPFHFHRKFPAFPFSIRKQKGSQAKDIIFLDLAPNEVSSVLSLRYNASLILPTKKKFFEKKQEKLLDFLVFI